MGPFPEPASAAQWLLFVASVVVAIGAIWNKGIKPAWKAYRQVSEGFRRVRDLIEAELNTNGGASMKDQSNLAAQQAAFAALKADDAAKAAEFISAQLEDVKGTQETIFEVFDDVVKQQGFERDEIWQALLGLGVDRRVPKRPPPGK